MKAFRHILVPTDGTALSLKAAKEAAGLAKDLHATVTALYVTPPWTPPMADESAVLADMGFSEKACQEAQAKEAADALSKLELTLVMASHGRHGLGALILGSETTKVLTHSRTPVLVCR